MTSPAGAQKLSVSGRVTDSKTGNPLPLVNVGLMRATDTVFVRGAATEFDGTFHIEDVAPGSYLLQASCVGYAKHVEVMEVRKDIDGLAITLKGGTLLETVKVVAEKPLYLMDGEKNMYNTKEDPSIQSGTASDALQNAPGVEVDAEGNITLRGVSSVEIWINDRPSHMNEEALKQYIKQLPANAIERIEVITNPSARYSTSGGVVNIVTNQKVTRNELLCMGVRAQTSPSVSPWASYVFANEKVDFNLYLNASYMRYDIESDQTSTLFNDAGDTSRYQRNESRSHADNKGGYSGINFNWNISEQTNLTTWLGVYPYWGNAGSTADLQYFEYQPTLRNLGYHYEEHDQNGFGWGGYAGAWLEHRFDTTGRKVSFSLSSSTWNNKRDVDYETFAYYDPWRDTLMRRKDNKNSSPSVDVSLDYVHPFKNGLELQTGAEVNLGGSMKYVKLDTLSQGIYVQVPLRSYEGTERGTGLNGYVALQKRWGGFTAKLGLRGKQDWKHSVLRYLDGSGSAEVDTALFGLVPSIHLSYQTKSLSNYGLSYTRRHSIPDIVLLTPFRCFDDYSFETGNPGLRISYTHNVEAAWNKYIPSFGNIGVNAYFRANTDEVGSMSYAGYAPEYYGSQLVMYTRPENIGSSHTEGLELNVTYRPTGFLNVRLNGAVCNYGYDYHGFRDSRVSWNARLNVWAKLWKKFEVFANARYSSPRLGLYSVSVPSKGVDFGMSGDFFDRKLSVYFNVNDIFGMAEWGSNSTAPSYKTTGSRRYDSRFVSLGLTWRLGKMELASKARQGAMESSGVPQM